MRNLTDGDEIAKQLKEEEYGIELDELVRDVTKVGSIPKSEVYSRIRELIDIACREAQLEIMDKAIEIVDNDSKYQSAFVKLYELRETLKKDL